MLSKVLALSAATAVHAATGNSTALCIQLLTGNCAAAAHFPTPLPTVAQCAAQFDTAVGTTAGAKGDDATPGANTIGCRQYYANMATSTTLYWCKFAGFTGGGNCGQPVTNACNAIDANCIGNGGYSYTGVGSQTAACNTDLTPSLGAIWGSLQGAAGGSENSLECRVYHSIVGWNNANPTPATDVHCGHVSSTSPPCNGNVTTDGNHHCAYILSACNTTGRMQYNNFAQCTASFASFPQAYVTASGTANDRGCRQYHAQAATALNNLVHCQHGGPSGGAVCGTSKQAWASLANNTACMTAFPYLSFSVSGAFANWLLADLTTVVPDGDTANFTVGAVGDNDNCRLYHLTVATQDQTHCPHGLILSPTCPSLDVSAAACRIIQTGCGTAVYADQATCVTAIQGLAALNKTGGMTVGAAPNTDDIACRVYQAGVALGLKKAGQPTASTCAASKNCGKGMQSSATKVAASALFVAVPALFAL